MTLRRPRTALEWVSAAVVVLALVVAGALGAQSWQDHRRDQAVNQLEQGLLVNCLELAKLAPDVTDAVGNCLDQYAAR